MGGYFEERSRALGLLKNGELVAGVIYENWNQRSIFCHIAITGSMTPAFLAAIFDYPFVVCEAEKIIVPVGQDNEQSIRLVQNMGFKEEARLKDARPDGDLIFFTLNKTDCRFLGEKYGKRLASSTSSA
jgi:RimJ/RimL family protein N-acetyltransferase